MSACPDLVIATSNPGKFRELAQALRSTMPIQLGSLLDFPAVQPVEETGLTFRENAELKALRYAEQIACRVLADDSGLEVDALGGAPGVHSARYGGAEKSDAERVRLLLEHLTQVDDSRRTARFVCVIAVADKASEIFHSWTGICEGKIARHPIGVGGFGYDPVFIPRGYNQTFGELPVSLKQQISHRAVALAAAGPFLEQLFKNTP